VVRCSAAAAVDGGGPLPAARRLDDLDEAGAMPLRREQPLHAADAGARRRPRQGEGAGGAADVREGEPPPPAEARGRIRSCRAVDYGALARRRAQVPRLPGQAGDGAARAARAPLLLPTVLRRPGRRVLGLQRRRRPVSASRSAGSSSTLRFRWWRRGIAAAALAVQ
jgi:hypothetical protein